MLKRICGDTSVSPRICDLVILEYASNMRKAEEGQDWI